ncbi:MAG: 3-dehydroquinate synthase [Actinomycetota bacterium]
MATVTVATPSRTYDVTIGAGILDRADALLPPLPGAEKAFVVADDAVASLAFAPLGAALERRGLRIVRLAVPAGEAAKTLGEAERLLRALAAAEAHRDDVVVALGGGSVGDLAGFVAATYMRGVPVVQVPTSLTAQVDAAIGGKTAVNLPEGKNLVGAYHQPIAVLADVALLASLPPREVRAGLAEIAKVALALDADLLDLLGARTTAVLKCDPDVLEPVVCAAVRAKAAVVATDERDGGARLVLNYGHTLGHALERLDGFGVRTHGEAVAVGMRFAARLAARIGVGSSALVDRHDALLGALGLGDVGGLPATEDLLAALRMDKKYAGGLRFVLLEALGRPRVVEGVGEGDVRAALADLGAAA